MRATKSKHSLLKIMVLICNYCLLNSMIANSEVIAVGGPNRWTDGFDYVSWAQQYTFTVGDVLVFSYSEGKHNVYDVSKATFQSCEPSNGVNAIYKSGNDEVELKEAKQYWFICTVDQHCSLGMKLGITVSPSSMNGPQTNTSTTTITSNKNFASATHFSSGIYLVAAGILSILVFIS